jgi:hypothetical protein
MIRRLKLEEENDMQRLLRGLGLAVVLVSAMTGISAARAAAEAPDQEICTTPGTCSVSGLPCRLSGQCGSGQTCICS